MGENRQALDQSDVEERLNVTVDDSETLVVEEGKPLQFPDQSFLHKGRVFSTSEADPLMAKVDGGSYVVDYWDGDELFRVVYSGGLATFLSENNRYLVGAGLFFQVLGALAMLSQFQLGLFVVLLSAGFYAGLIDWKPSYQAQFKQTVSSYRDEFIREYEKLVDGEAVETGPDGMARTVEPRQRSGDCGGFDPHIFTPAFARYYNEKHCEA